MGYKLDSILKKKLVEGPLAISSDYTTPEYDISGAENSFSVQADYSGGVGLDMTLYLEVSTNGTAYIRIDESSQNVTDASGSHLWDVTEMGVVYLRVAFVINAGSCVLDQTIVSAKRRH